MASLIEGKADDADLNPETIDWDKELAHFKSQVQSAVEYHGRERRGHKTSSAGAVVLLTGTTRFLVASFFPSSKQTLVSRRSIAWLYVPGF